MINNNFYDNNKHNDLKLDEILEINNELLFLKEKYIKMEFSNSNNIITSTKKNDKNSILWNITRSGDYLNKPFLRFTLKRELDNEEINNLLDIISKSNISLKIGNLEFDIDLFIIFLLHKKLSKNIELIHINNIIKDKLIQKKNDGIICNSKYFSFNENDIYLDIPLLFDFFMCNMSIPLIKLVYHEICFQLIYNNKIFDYCENIDLMFEEIVYNISSVRKIMAENEFKSSFILPNSKYTHNNFRDEIFQENIDTNSIFSFIIIKHNNIDINNNIIDLPQILNIKLNVLKSVFVYPYFEEIYIELNNIWFNQYDDMIIYGIATDGISNMKNWNKIINKTNDYDIMKLKTNNINDNYEYNDYINNSNPSTIHVTFSNYNCPINIEIINFCYKSYTFCNGMVYNTT